MNKASWVSLASATALVLAPTAPALAQDNAAVYRPDSDWAVDYGEDYCRLMRDFSNGEDRVGLVIERTQPGPMIRLGIAGDSINLFRGAEQVGYSMLPAGSQRTAQPLRLRTGDDQQYLNFGQIPLVDMAPPQPGAAPAAPPPYSRDAEKEVAGSITGNSLTRGLTKPVQIETGELGGPVEALQVCADELLTHWGLDAEAHKQLSRPVMPEGPTTGWIDQSTIGFEDFARLAGGNNEFRVLVDSTGAPQSCAVHWPSLEAPTNEEICGKIMERGRFAPALDQAGQPIDSYWTTSGFLLMPRR